MPNDDGSEIHQPSYDTGYREGESSGYTDWIFALSEAFDLEPFEGPSDFIKNLRVWVYQGKEAKVFATAEAAQAWFDENDPEGVAFEYEVLT